MPKRQLASILLFGLSAPFLLFPNRATIIAFVVMLGAIGLVWDWQRVERLMVSPLLLVVVMAVIGRSIAPDLELANNRFWNILLQLLTCLFIITQSAFSLRRLTLLLLVGGLLLELIGFFGMDWAAVRLFNLPFYESIPSLIPSLTNGGGGEQGGINPRIVGIMAGYLLPFVVGTIFWRELGIGRYLAAIVALFTTLLIILTQAPMGLVGMVIGLLALALFHWRKLIWLYLFGAVVTIAALFVVDLTPIQRIAFDIDHPVGIAVLLRLDMWRQSLAMIHDMPFTGIGLNNYPVVLSTTYPGYLIGAESHAHNWFLQTAHDLGVVGLVALLWFLSAFVVTVWRSDGSIVLYGCAASVIAYLATGVADSRASGQKEVIVLWAIIGLGFTLLPSTKWRWQLVPVVGLAVFAVGLWLLLPVVRSRNMAVIRAHQALLTERTVDATDALERAVALNSDNPRLWMLKGRVSAENATYPTAIADFTRRVELDKIDPLARYAPFLNWQPNRPTDPLANIYAQWRTRYPDRAEFYVLSALLSGNAAFVDEGIAQSAEPLDLLRWMKAEP